MHIVTPIIKPEPGKQGNSQFTATRQEFQACTVKTDAGRIFEVNIYVLNVPGLSTVAEPLLCHKNKSVK